MYWHWESSALKRRGARLAVREARNMHMVEQLGNRGRPAEQVRLAHTTCKTVTSA